MRLSICKEMTVDTLQTGKENDELAVVDNDESVSAQTGTDVLNVDETSTYSELYNEISQPGPVKLKYKKYVYDYVVYTAIQITEENKIIDGNGAVIDACGSIAPFMVSASGVTIKNLTIEDAHSFEYGAAIYFEKSGTVTNCNFNSNLADSAGGAIYFIFL